MILQRPFNLEENIIVESVQHGEIYASDPSYPSVSLIDVSRRKALKRTLSDKEMFNRFGHYIALSEFSAGLMIAKANEDSLSIILQ